MAPVHEYDPIYTAKSRRMVSKGNFETGFLSTKVGLLVDNKADSARINVTLGARSRNHFCRAKAVSITYSECAPVILVIQHEMRVRRTILLSVASLAVQYFFTPPHKRRCVRVKLLDIKCVF